jgi:two-component system response regulator (stage 0 sporulation protein A)
MSITRYGISIAKYDKIWYFITEKKRGWHGLELKKLLIADASEEFRDVLQEYLKDTYLIKVCREGNEAFQALRSFQPDVMILDMLLPGIDGVTLLQKMETAGLHPTVLAVTRFASDYMMDAVERLGVGYLIVKPCDVSAVAARLEDLLRGHFTEQTQEVTPPDMNTLVNNALWELRIPTHPRGFGCLREALLLTLQEPGQQVTKTLYPAVGKRCGGNADQVEHAIRRLIKQAWVCRDEEVWNRYFASVPDAAVKCPGNKVFISAVANYILEDHQNRGTYFTQIG